MGLLQDADTEKNRKMQTKMGAFQTSCRQCSLRTALVSTCTDLSQNMLAMDLQAGRTLYHLRIRPSESQPIMRDAPYRVSEKTAVLEMASAFSHAAFVVCSR